MRVTVFACGPAANESETLAANHLKRQLEGAPGDDHWILLTNLAFSVTHQFQSDEIDIVVIGPPGVRVIEVKHWSPGWIDAKTDIVEMEANKTTNKARKIGTTLRRIAQDLPRVDGAFLLTQPVSKFKRVAGREVRGVTFHTLNHWKGAIGFDEPRVLSALQVSSLGHALAPKSAVAIDGSLRRLAGYVNLELQTPKEQRDHRVYKGSHPARRDRVVLHLYDLSATDDANAETKARREALALQRLQLFSWAPRILDSWQDAPGYAGEMYFFTIVDPAAPCIEDRSSDETWDFSSRLTFARKAVRALLEFHDAGGSEESFVHRNLTPRTVLVRYDNSPIFTGFDRTRIPSDLSVASAGPPVTDYPATLAPEVHAHGWAAADQRSDIYSLCASLSGIFAGADDGLASGAVEILATGMANAPDERCKLAEIERSLSELLGDSAEPPAAPPARFWTEDQVIRFNSRDYRIVTRLGSGGIGTAFKVVEVDRPTKEDLGTYVAKVAHDRECGDRVLKAYRLARPCLRHEALSPIYESAHEWQENQLISLLGWVEGTPLSEFTGVFPLLAEDLGEESPETLAISFLEEMCDALDVLHRNGLTHGDVSPKNMIVSSSNIVLTDYDFVTRIDDIPTAPGTVPYCSPSRQEKIAASAGDDLFALAASFFHVLFEKEPFRYGGELAKERGLNWNDADRAEYPLLAGILDKATHTDQCKRITSATEMLAALRESRRAAAQQNPSGEAPAFVPNEVSSREPSTQLKEQRIDWLKSLLQSYPGSRWGNRETRGLDTRFASDTYVSTPLEESLLDDIRNCRVRLVILCGNAGDGKTALLQHLAQELGLGKHQSADRILEGRVPNGPRVRMNLDGSAAWKGKSADEILDEFLAPFHDGPPKENIVQLLAINDGRLLEWIEGVEDRIGKDTSLTAELYELLQRESVVTDSHIRFISLNQRSVVGGVTPDRSRIDTTFLEQLLDHLYGGERAREIWSPCHACSAMDRCTVFQAARVFGPHSLRSPIGAEARHHARRRLFEAIQAVHLRG